ncbi:MAG: penicillin acylase family protein [Acidobacteriota bacterium]|nr:penicillin acylase family protein [Acidobacteriota bacterium]
MKRIHAAFIAVSVVAVAAGTVLLLLHRPLPRVSGELAVQGLSSPVEILRDRYGIPHIRAASRHDALFALGFVHAQDRLWQMEVQRRAAAGRLSEILGPAALPTDRFMRTIGLARAARAAHASLDPESAASIRAYVAGVNAFLADTSGSRLPVEFALTGARAEPWTPDDAVATMKLLAWMQGMNWREELLHIRLTDRLGAARASELVPGELDGATILPSISTENAAALAQIARALEHLAPPSAAASNSWVLSGARTATGRPILANDPHIPAQAPASWYLAHITGGSLDAAGATFPGTCAIVIGHNARVAWGLTNAMADAQDLVVVRHTEPVTSIAEVIKVKGQADEHMTVRVSEAGPIISDLVGQRGLLALRWTGLDPADASVRAFFGLNEAANAAGVRDALTHLHAPALSVVYADVDGDVGFAAAGAVPVRATAGGAWTARARAESIASLVNPESGFIVTANNAIGGRGRTLSTSFEVPYRAERITEMIEREPALALADVARMQQDVVSLQPRALRALLFDRAEPRDATGAAALAKLKAWDGSMARGSAEGVLYKRYYAETAAAMLRDDLGPGLWQDYLAATASLSRAMHRFAARGGADGWCDDIELPGRQTCGAMLGEALSRAIEGIAREQGCRLQAWRWDRANSVRFAHAPMDAVPLLRPIFSRTLARPGDQYTVNPSMAVRDQMLVASYRQILDVGDWDRSMFVIPMGQSGHPLSAHYADLLPLWNEGRYVPMAFTDGAVRAAAWHTLTLRPRLRPQ